MPIERIITSPDFIALACFPLVILFFAYPWLKGSSRRHIGLANLVGAVGHFAMAGVYFSAWLGIPKESLETVPILVWYMVAEFILMHANAFFAHLMLTETNNVKRIKRFAQLVMLYSVFIISMAIAMKSTWALVVLWLPFLAKQLPLLRLPGETPENRSQMELAATSAWFYLVGVFVTLIYPLPVLSATGYFGTGGDGLWDNQPHKVLGFGVFYFTSLAIATLLSGPLSSPSDRQVARRK